MNGWFSVFLFIYLLIQFVEKVIIYKVKCSLYKFKQRHSLCCVCIRIQITLYFDHYFRTTRKRIAVGNRQPSFEVANHPLKTTVVSMVKLFLFQLHNSKKHLGIYLTYDYKSTHFRFVERKSKQIVH